MKEELRHPLGLRLIHWGHAVCMFLLLLSGYYIHNPDFGIFTSMDSARKVHFVAAYLILALVVVRIYYALVKKDFSGVIFTWKDIKGLYRVARYYCFVDKKHPEFDEKYNPGQKIMYSTWIFLLLIQAITGFILYLPTASSELASAYGGPMMVRMIHYLVFWVFVSSVAVHLYLDFTDDWQVLKSMFTGCRREPKLVETGKQYHGEARG